MAKDGTLRGYNKSPNAGRKSKPLADKIRDGDTNLVALPTPPDLEGVDMPTPKQYLLDAQKGTGKPTCAKEIFEQTWKWLESHGCQGLILPQIVEDYAAAVGRKIQFEEAMSQYGFLGKHPTTGAPTQSVFFKMMLEIEKQVIQLYLIISQVVKDNCAEGYDGAPMQDEMERILRRVK